MAKKKVYLPKWQRWFLVPTMTGTWALITYLEFFSEKNKDELGLIGYLILSVILFSVSIMIWLMTSGKLPAYLIEDGQSNKDN